MPNLIILVGPPGSGKSTRALHLETQGYVRISQDDQGKERHMEMFYEALMGGKDVVVDRMNFNVEQRSRYLKPAKEGEYATKIITFFVPRITCHLRCALRKGHPTIVTEENAISALNTFFTKFERPTENEADVLEFDYQHSEDRADCIIVDLDGTLCNIDHRLHHVRKEGKKNWKAFSDGLVGDTVNEWCRRLIDGTDYNSHVVLCSGRSHEYRELTIGWLGANNIPYSSLFMRPDKDYRQDCIIKEIILDFEILPRYNPIFAVDDRKQVTDMWRRRGITCLQCAEGNF